MTDHDVTTNEIMDFLQENMVTREEFSQLDAKVGQLDAKVGQLDAKVGQLDAKVGQLDAKVDGLDKKLNQTKLDLLDAIDDKLGDLKGDLVVLMRKEDQKVNNLIQLLVNRKLISEKEAISLIEIRPFSQPIT
ncbi:hypothetical protein HYV69_02690 [Candidatus Uhrbacteria bacterium]|nr:hypothetical protein [Candidatus Uhrbacteria bacterium]